MSGLVVVCGLEAEAKIARGRDCAATAVAVGGNAARLVGQLDALSPRAVLSFGLAGGLEPGLSPGTARIADVVIDTDGRRYPTDRSWAAALVAVLDVSIASIAGVSTPLASRDAKAELRQTTGAALVDMESHIVADWAARRGIPFAALRVVSDPAEQSLPHAATVGMRADGTVDLPAVLSSLAKTPRQLPGLIRTAFDARAAMATLFRCRQRLGPGFALFDL